MAITMTDVIKFTRIVMGKRTPTPLFLSTMSITNTVLLRQIDEADNILTYVGGQLEVVE